MSTLREFLVQKRDKVLANQERLASDPPATAKQLSATVTAEGRSGVRRIRIRDLQILSDSGPELAGYDLGPTSPELQLGVLGSCLTHVYEIQAALAEIPLDSLQVEVRGQIEPRAGQPGFEDVPRQPHAISYEVHLQSPAGQDQLRALHQRVEEVCPILNLLTRPQHITGKVLRNGELLVDDAT
jgi:uncharacterized OsmC-like protein